MKISVTDSAKLVPIGEEGYRKGQEQAVTYLDKISNYKELIYDEDAKILNPELYYNNGKGGRNCETVSLDGEQAERFMKECGLEKFYEKGDNVNLSLLWTLPRKEYNETDMYVHMSGFTFPSKPPFFSKSFIIADYCVTKEAQEKAMNLIDMLNEWAEEERSLPEKPKKNKNEREI